MYRIFCTWVSREIRTNIITITTLTFHKSFDKENVLEVHECISGIRLRYKLAFFNPDHYCVVLKYSIYFTLDRRKRVFQEKKNEGPTEIWTRIAGFKVQSANHYTIEPCLDSYSLIFHLVGQISKQVRKKKVVSCRVRTGDLVRVKHTW